MTIRQILRDKDINKDVAPLDAELLLSFVLKKPREFLFAHPEKALSKQKISEFIKLARKRKKGEPIACITGKKEFYGLDFEIDKNVLVPRPETELLVESIIQKIPGKIPDTIVDVGTGSGNIIVSLVKNLPTAAQKKINFYATDISSKALKVAKINAKKHGVEKHIKFIQSDLLEYFLNKKINLGNALIVANLPYVSASIYKKYRLNLQFEPKTALVSEHNGLGHYSRLLIEIKEIATRGYAPYATCYTEFSPEQKRGLHRLVRQNLTSAAIKYRRDLAGKFRMAEISIAPKAN